MRPHKPWQNSSGCNDLTAYTATKPTVEERRVSAFCGVRANSG